MSRRKPSHETTARSRQLPPTALPSPVETRRLRDAAVSGLRDAVWGSQLGRLHVTGALDASQLAAGKYWSELTSAYSVACRSPAGPRTVLLDAVGGQPIDPDTASGAKEIARHERATAAWIEGRDVLRKAGPAVEAAVDAVCIQDQAPDGYMQLSRSGPV
jgi:hypothetical protein